MAGHICVEGRKLVCGEHQGNISAQTEAVVLKLRIRTPEPVPAYHSQCQIQAHSAVEQEEGLPATFFASMGAALKMDSLKIDVAEFWKVKGCPLAASLRRKFKKNKTFPAKKFKCVYSEELMENQGTASLCGTDQCICKENGNSLADNNQKENDWHAAKVHTNGTIAHTTAIFGFTLAGLVIQDILKKINAE